MIAQEAEQRLEREGDVVNARRMQGVEAVDDRIGAPRAEPCFHRTALGSYTLYYKRTCHIPNERLYFRWRYPLRCGQGGGWHAVDRPAWYDGPEKGKAA